MKKNILILLPLLGIVFSAWNTPYINTDETLELKYGMSKSSVLDIIGLPLYVEKGWPSGNSNELIWIYEIRTTKVASKQSAGAIEIVKTSASKRPDGKIHRLKLTFQDNKLVNWEPIKEKVLPNLSIDLEVLPSMPSVSMPSASSSGLSIHPKISMVLESWELFDSEYYEGGGSYRDYSTSGKGVRVGVAIGKPMFGMNVGLDISLGSGTGFMLFADKEMFGFHWVVSFGKDAYTYDAGDGSFDADGSFKFGVFKDLALPLSIGIETIGRENGWWNYDVGSGTFFTVKYKMRN